MRVYEEKKVRQSEILQLLLLDNLYAQSGSEKIIFQGGTALRWVYGGMRFSEDLDFISSLPKRKIESLLDKARQKIADACLVQFGPGQTESQIKGSRQHALKIYHIYRPEAQRERIAVKMEFETLRSGRHPDFKSHIMRELPAVAGLIAKGDLILPYTSSIILTETPQEILSDKIRALYERRYLKGRDIYDIWWMVNQLNISPDWLNTQKKLSMYAAAFVPFRDPGYFQDKASVSEVVASLEADLPRFLPGSILAEHRQNEFRHFIQTVNQVTVHLLDQGLRGYLENVRGKVDT
ncbi:MAG: nucleotidyl transferase AbiEii/AbiGii toxin family protein [Thermodesulfobacteriota bacterium]